MQFYNWMKKNYEGEDSERGDLFEDMKCDKGFPRNPCPGKYDAWFDIIYRHLKILGACNEAIDTFEECWRDYVKHEREIYRKQPRYSC